MLPVPWNAEILPEHAGHPGWAADGCVARMTVTASRSHGFACRVTGEHCLPGERCDRLRAHWSEFLAEQDMLAKIDPAYAAHLATLR